MLPLKRLINMENLEQLVDKFLLQCKANYFENITPSNKEAKSSIGYLELVDIGKKYFYEGGSKKFENFFYESQYLVELWAAHLYVEHFTNHNDELLNLSFKIIKKYSESTIDEKIAIEEKKWLEENSGKYLDY